MIEVGTEWYRNSKILDGLYSLPDDEPIKVSLLFNRDGQKHVGYKLSEKNPTTYGLTETRFLLEFHPRSTVEQCLECNEIFEHADAEQQGWCSPCSRKLVDERNKAYAAIFPPRYEGQC